MKHELAPSLAETCGAGALRLLEMPWRYRVVRVQRTERSVKRDNAHWQHAMEVNTGISSLVTF